MIHMNGSISCIILVGGKSHRMGKPKHFLHFNGIPILELQKRSLKRLFKEIIVVTSQTQTLKDSDIKIVADIYPDLGPMGGLYTGLQFSSKPHNFLIACDMPYINLRLIQYMIHQIKNHDIVIPESSYGLQALHAIYSKRCLKGIAYLIKQRHLRLYDLTRLQNTRFIAQQEINEYDPQELSFQNINTPAEYRKATRMKKNLPRFISEEWVPASI